MSFATQDSQDVLSDVERQHREEIKELEAKLAEAEVAKREQHSNAELWNLKFQKVDKKLSIAIEALSDWIEWEDEQIKKDGAYVSVRLNGLIKQGKVALEKIQRG